ncbi:PIN domain-containing protein [Benzoatithermus flavus]|uniref:PIN domain-containing protein n=1 Tax=Benzoatithermus flavus TaxID=3108223 RepID=A0ABU8XY15_9PROT
MVIDSSALIALLMHEPGWERVMAAVTAAVAPTTILSELVGYFAKNDLDLAELRSSLRELDLDFVALDHETAWLAGEMEPATRAAGLSLADRSCLALARRLDRVALTGDRTWIRVARDLGIEVELFR